MRHRFGRRVPGLGEAAHYLLLRARERVRRPDASATLQPDDQRRPPRGVERSRHDGRVAAPGRHVDHAERRVAVDEDAVRAAELKRLFESAGGSSIGGGGALERGSVLVERRLGLLEGDLLALVVVGDARGAAELQHELVQGGPFRKVFLIGRLG